MYKHFADCQAVKLHSKLGRACRAGLKRFPAKAFVANSSGNITLMSSLVAIPLIAAAGIAVDYGRATRAHQQLQLIADSATLAAASAEHVGGSPANQTLQRAQIASNYVNGALPRIKDIVLTAQPSVTVGASSISVGIQGKVKGSLTNVLSMLPQSAGIGSGGGGSIAGSGNYMDIDVSAKSLAKWSLGVQYVCMLALNQSKSQALSIQGTADIGATNCAVYDNSSATDGLYENGTAALAASMICVYGNYMGNAYTPTPKSGCGRLADPLATQYAADKAATFASAPVFSNYSCSSPCLLQPGVYDKGIAITNGKIATLAPGVFFMKDGPLDVRSGGTVNGLNGSTIVLVGTNAALKIAAGGNLNLKAPAAGPFAGIALAQDPAAIIGSGNPNRVIGGGSLSITGAVYFPNHDFYVTGNGTSVTNLSTGNPQFAIVADSITIQGNGQVHVGGGSDYASAGLPALPTNGLAAKPSVSLQ